MTETTNSAWEVLSDAPALEIARRGGAVRLRLRRPERLNAFDSQLSEDFLAALQRLAGDDTVRSILITGTGRAFSAGADIKSEFAGGVSPEVVRRDMQAVTNPTIRALRELAKPVVAAVNGVAAGLGCSIALACDLVIAAESAYFLLAFANIGLTIDGGASMLVAARAGFGRALTMALLAERIPAQQALAWGLADRVVPDDELVSECEELAVRLACGPTRSYAASKQAVNATVLFGIAEALDREASLQAQMAASSDFAEGVRAFTEGRAPRFDGQ